ncbi:MAG: hypothetical protein GKR89_00720 [Candidatus Latescibacteria bacterium]|nr:hypothetical protein [Candidatus Latescibacterota bacterium]
MPPRPTFARHLIGQPPQPRPPFYYAYVVFWLHLLAGLGYLGLTRPDAWERQLPLLILAALSLSLVLYALLIRRYLGLLHLPVYALALSGLGGDLPPGLMLIPALLAPPSVYLVLIGEYRTYDGTATTSPRAVAILALGLLLLCLYGLWLEGIINGS